MTQPKYGQALATDKGAVADAGQPAVPTESQIDREVQKANARRPTDSTVSGRETTRRD